ncbi:MULTISPECIES: sensor histidine kinase [unclassified Coleofasciculus]|uniref:sensor histidine kinase n=1 Tax=unclassified Coleofasciculus TaxID=2692782 RepID=UPI0018807684|nr:MULTISPECIES: HAMP domain-containing sensor histidine kinase [unclassified Coleofasciculus]MBE9129518.1 HAMP domain-containing histidine kinase [Coleofasciculus sp. LEGE 07081]MBE9151876.1 HAMP domain-containing histidine kinase [Coleofasciculus sp. LEGE 07092]
MDFSQALLDKIDQVVENWVETVRQDGEIKKTQELTYKGILDGLPVVLRSIANILSKSEAKDLQTLVESSLEHGIIRAKQGYDPEEVAREYRLLRQVIFSTLEENLLQGSPKEVLRAVRLIDTSLDEVIAQCFQSYTEERLRELDQLKNHLALTNQELTRLVNTHQEYLSYLAHDLKNPLTSIIGYSDLFLRQQRKNLEAKDGSPNLEYIERVLRNGRQLLRLINDALEVSRYEAGKMKLCPEITDVCSLINSVVEILEASAHAKELQINVDYKATPLQVHTDPLRLEQIVTNLLSNAIRYTESGTVNVTFQVLSDNQFAIAVSDTGIGIAPEDQAHIFEPYFRAGSRPNRLPDSTGLGLAIVWRLVQLLQGEIQLKSQVGVGSTFRVILPLNYE